MANQMSPALHDALNNTEDQHMDNFTGSYITIPDQYTDINITDAFSESFRTYNESITTHSWPDGDSGEVWKHLLGYYINFYGSIILTVLGIFGNGLCLYILNNSQFGELSSTYMMKALTLADLLAIIASQLVNFPIYVLNIDLTVTHPVMCKLLLWLVNSLAHFANFALAGFSVDRCLAISQPFWYRSFSKKKIQQNICLFTSLGVMASMNSYTLFSYDVREVYWGPESELKCTQLHHGKQYFGIPGGEWIELAVCMLLPSVLIVISNSVIIYSLAGTRMATHEINKATSHKSKEDKSVIWMLLFVSITFILLLAPYHVMLIIYMVPSVRLLLTPATQLLLFRLALFCKLLNNAINFVLYLISGKIFRAEICKICKRIRDKLWSKPKRERRRMQSVLSISYENTNDTAV